MSFNYRKSGAMGVLIPSLISFFVIIIEGFDLAPIRRALNSCVNIFNLYGCF